MRKLAPVLIAAGMSVFASAPAVAQEEEGGSLRVRVGIGAQAVPSYPGADKHAIRPLVDVAVARGDEPFRFEAADESFGFGLFNSGGFSAGPVVNFEGSRKQSDVGAPVDKVGATFEVGGFVEYDLNDSFRIRAEARKGLGGHEAWTGLIGADYVVRDGDKWLFAIGPRVTISDARFHRAYFGVTPAESVRTGLAIFDPDGGVQAIGGTAGFITQLTERWGIYSYAKYDRLVGDAGRSPVVRAFGSRDQFSGGLALTYTFGG